MTHQAGRIVIAALTLVVATTPTRGQSDSLVVHESAAPCLVIRARPESTAPKRACLAPGTRITPIASAPYWRQVKLANGTKGWGAKKFLVASGPAPVSPDTTKWLEVHFVDVGQGDGILIRTPDDGVKGNGLYDGLTVVIDGGPDKTDAGNAMFKYIAKLFPQGTSIDAMIISHPHDDHYPGAWGLLSHYTVRDFYDAGFPKAGVTWKRFMTDVRSAKGPDGQPIRLHIGATHLDTPSWGRELDAEFLYAYPGDSAGLGHRNTLENNASIVLKLTYGRHSFLFMGDAEGKERGDSPQTAQFAEAILLRQPERVKATVLKIAHHGSETSSTLPFIRAVDPDYLVVMSGRKEFGTVHLTDATTLQRYCDHKPATRILRSEWRLTSPRGEAAEQAVRLVRRTGGEEQRR